MLGRRRKGLGQPIGATQLAPINLHFLCHNTLNPDEPELFNGNSIHSNLIIPANCHAACYTSVMLIIANVCLQLAT